MQVCLGRKIKPRETHIMIIAFINVYGANGYFFMFVDAVLGKTTLLEANFGIFKYQQVFINVWMCHLVKFVVIFCEQAQLVGPGLWTPRV